MRRKQIESGGDDGVSAEKKGKIPHILPSQSSWGTESKQKQRREPRAQPYKVSEARESEQGSGTDNSPRLLARGKKANSSIKVIHHALVRLGEKGETSGIESGSKWSKPGNWRKGTLASRKRSIVSRRLERVSR